jgi:ribose transport system permease protein
MPELIKRFLPFLSLIVLCILIAVLEPKFISAGNLASVVRQTAVITIMAIGMTMVMVSGGIDLSVGSMMALCGVLGAFAMKADIPVPLAILLTLGAGAVFGLINGATISALKIPAFIVTLGAMGIYRGTALNAADGQGIVGLPTSLGYLAEGNLLGFLPMPLVLVAVVALIVHFILTSTRAGRYCYAIGSNPEAARYSGINVTRYRMLYYAILGALTGLSGSLESSRLIAGQPTGGQGYELNVIAAVVIGGGSLNGGQGSVIGTIIGSLIMGVLANGSNLLGIKPFTQQIIIGAVIILAVTFDEYQRKKLEQEN